MARFPSPYLNDCNAMDPVMERVPVDMTNIGANAAGMPGRAVDSDIMKIKHVGGALSKGE